MVLRKMLRTLWTEKVAKNEVLRMAGTIRKILNDLRTRQLRCMGHYVRKSGLEDLALTGKIDGKGAGCEGLCFGWPA